MGGRGRNHFKKDSQNLNIPLLITHQSNQQRAKLMASSAKHFTFIFFFLSLLTTQLVQARELHSFNKVTPKTTPTTTTTTTPSTTTTIPKETIAEAPNTENDPNFTPESQPNYGLFGQDSDNLSPYTTTTSETTTTPPYTTTNVPYKPQVEDEANSNPNYYNKDGYMTETQNMGGPRFGGRGTTNGNNYYNNGGGGGAGGGNNHNVQQQGISGSRALENGKYFYDVQNEKSNNYQRGVYYNDNNNFDQEDFGDPSLMDQGYTTPTTTSTTINNHHNYYHGANYQNTQKQGMSDTRFLENGKYYYDVKNEKSYSPNMYPNQNQRGPYYNDNSQLEDFNDPTLMDQGYTTNSNHNNNYYSNGGNYQNTQQQGMSDTRFLENGKYFYDVQNENKYQNSYPDSFDNRGHYGNNENLYENYGSMDGYQNQEQLQDGYGQYDP